MDDDNRPIDIFTGKPQKTDAELLEIAQRLYDKHGESIIKTPAMARWRDKIVRKSNVTSLAQFKKKKGK
jgi:hypothetical protein